eukprot:4725569-Pleurochrysis_carterae.AAC.7
MTQEESHCAQVAVPALKSKKSKGDLELKPGTPDTVSCDEISLRSAKEENEDEGAKETTDAAVVSTRTCSDGLRRLLACRKRRVYGPADEASAWTK